MKTWTLYSGRATIIVRACRAKKGEKRAYLVTVEKEASATRSDTYSSVVRVAVTKESTPPPSVEGRAMRVARTAIASILQGEWYKRTEDWSPDDFAWVASLSKTPPPAKKRKKRRPYGPAKNPLSKRRAQCRGCRLTRTRTVLDPCVYCKRFMPEEGLRRCRKSGAEHYCTDHVGAHSKFCPHVTKHGRHSKKCPIHNPRKKRA